MSDTRAPPAVWFPAVRAHSGADVFTERLCTALNAQGIRADITWLPLRAEYAPWSVPVPRPPDWATVVHANSWLHPRFLPPHLPVVTTLHSCVHDPALRPYKSPPKALYHAAWIRHVEAAHLRRADCVVAVSSYTAEMAKRVFGRSDIEVIYNGVDTTVFHPIDRAAPNRPFRLLYVGNWDARKGVDLLGPILRALGPDFELHYTADRNGRHTRYALPPNTRCIGRLAGAELVRAYQTADALLFPSRLEGFGLVVAEAMACGLPVIAANTSSLPELIEHQKTGFLVAHLDTNEFIQAALKLKNDILIWKSMKSCARIRAEAYFSLQLTINIYSSLYESTTRNIPIIIH